MMGLYGVFRILIICVWCVLLTNGQSKENGQKEWNTNNFEEQAKQTFTLVFHKYNPGIRPPRSYVDIKMNVIVRHIRQLDVQKQELQTVLDLEMMWHDSRLSFLAYLIPRIMVNSSVVWVPDIVVTNGILPSQPLYPKTVRVSNKGDMIWSRREMVTTYCKTSPDMLAHRCPISFGFLANLNDDYIDRIFSNESTLLVADDFSNNDWDLTSANPILMGDDENSTMYTNFDVMLELEKKNKQTESYKTAGYMGQNYSDVAGSRQSGSPPSYDVTSTHVVLSLCVAIFVCQLLGREYLIR